MTLTSNEQANIENKKSAYPERLALNNLKSARSTLCRYIRLRHADKVNSAKYRDILAGLNYLLAYDKTIKDGELEKRLDELEARLEGGQ